MYPINFHIIVFPVLIRTTNSFANTPQVSSYSFEDHKKSSQIRVLDVSSGESSPLIEEPGASEPVWLGDDEVLYLKAGGNGSTSLVVRQLGSAEASSYVLLGPERGMVLGVCD